MKLQLLQCEERIAPVVGSGADAPMTARGGVYGPQASPVNFDGVVKLSAANSTIASGWLLRTGMGQGFGHHIMTAKHVITDAAGAIDSTFELSRAGVPVDITIRTPSGATYQVLHDSQNNNPGGTRYDAGFLKLVDQELATQSSDRLMVAPYTSPQYELLPPGTLADDLSANIAVFAGYGQTGKGTTGQRAGTEGIKRYGSNVIDGSTPNDFLYDFDSGAKPDSTYGNLGLGQDIESIGSSGDSGSPLFVGGKVAGLFYGSTSTFYGAIGTAVPPDKLRVGLVTPYIDNAGAYDLVLNMNYQIYGRSGYTDPVAGGTSAALPENLTITAKNVNGMLELSVSGPEVSLNGVYYSAPAGNIKSLTIRGSDDNETIILDGPLGLSPTGSREVTIKGNGGKDIVRINGLDRAPTTDKYGTITVDGGAMSEGNELYIDDTRSGTDNTYDITSTYVVRRGLSPINYSNFTTVGLQSGGGSDQVFFNGTTADVKYLVNANGQATQDKCFVESGYLNDPLLEGFEYLKISGGTLKL